MQDHSNIGIELRIHDIYTAQDKLEHLVWGSQNWTTVWYKSALSRFLFSILTIDKHRTVYNTLSCTGADQESAGPRGLTRNTYSGTALRGDVQSAPRRSRYLGF
eukprot:6469217-Amphidinium_carterae.1